MAVADGATRWGRGIDLPTLVVEALEKVASPSATEELVLRALGRSGLAEMPVEAHRMLLFVAGALHEETHEMLGAPAAFGVVQDLRPMLERAMDQLLATAGTADTVPPQALASEGAHPSGAHPSGSQRPRSGIRANPHEVDAYRAALEAASTSRSEEDDSPSAWDREAESRGPTMPSVKRPTPHRQPRVRATSSPPTQPSGPRFMTMPYLAAIRDAGDVLIVDDDAAFRRAISRALTQRGFEVMAAADAPSALKLCHRIRPVLVVTDWQMPGLDGVELASLLHESLVDETPPIVLITGAPEPPEEPAHIAGVIRKGADFSAIFDLLEDVLSDLG